MKILLMSGFLGSGKTTLIQKFIRTIKARKLGFIAIIENEVGDIGIDNVLLSKTGVKVEPITGGCVCCEVTGSLIKALDEICTTYAPDWLIIELTGVAKLLDLKTAIERDATSVKQGDNSLTAICVVDGSRWDKLIVRAEYLIRRQVEGSDMLLVSKADLCENAESKREAVSKFFNGKQATLISNDMDDDAVVELLNGVYKDDTQIFTNPQFHDGVEAVRFSRSYKLKPGISKIDAIDFFRGYFGQLGTSLSDEDIIAGHVKGFLRNKENEAVAFFSTTAPGDVDINVDDTTTSDDELEIIVTVILYGDTDMHTIREQVEALLTDVVLGSVIKHP